MHVARFLPAAIRRAFTLMWLRLVHVFRETPVLFFGVVIAVAVIFRVGVGVAREAARPEVVAPTFVSTGPEPGLPSVGASASASTSASSLVRGLPAPPRVGPRPRGHGRRAVAPLTAP